MGGTFLIFNSFRNELKSSEIIALSLLYNYTSNVIEQRTLGVLSILSDPELYIGLGVVIYPSLQPFTGSCHF